MATRIEQCFREQDHVTDSKGNYTSAEIPYLVFGSQDEADALSSVRGIASSVYRGMALQSIEIDERVNDDTFKVNCVYERRDTEEDDSDNDDDNMDSSFAFDTGGGSQHITQSLGTVGRYPYNAPDYGGAIGYDGENVSGIDITMPVMNFSETHYFKPNNVTTGYKKSIAFLTGKINGAPFKGYNSGEVLFLGASGSRRGTNRSDWWEISFKFAVSPNRNGVRVGNIVVPNKLGWDYMWIRYADSLDGGGGNLVKTPVAAYVERVYEFGNFGNLGIGR